MKNKREISISYSLQLRLAALLLHRTTSRMTSNVRPELRMFIGAFGSDVSHDFPPVFVRAQSDNEASLFESQASTIVALTKNCKSAKIVRDLQDVPAGCGSSVVTPSVVVHILVRVSTCSIPMDYRH